MGGGQVASDLLDLYFLMANLDLEGNLATQLERLGSAGSIESAGQMRRMVTRAQRVLAKQLAPTVLLPLKRLIKEDPSLEPKIDTETRPYLRKYREQVTSQRQRRENPVGMSIFDLLGKVEPVELRGHEEELARKLHDEGRNSFTLLKAARVLKTFVIHHFERELKDAANRLIVEGYFENQSFLASLSNVFYDCSQGAKEVDEPVKLINDRARRLIEDATNQFYSPANLLRDVLQDYKQTLRPTS